MLGLLAALAACEGEAVGGSQPGGTTAAECQANSDCPGQLCSLGLCADLASGSAVVSLVFRPHAPRGQAVEQQTLDVPVRLGEALPTFVLQPPAPVNGTVILANRVGEATAVSAALSFFRVDALAGVTSTVSVHTTAPSAFDKRVFAARLAPGRYDVSVAPDEIGAPALVVRNVRVPVGGANVTIPVLNPLELQPVRGRLVHRTPGGDSTLPVAHVRVVATSLDGGVTLPTAETDVDGIRSRARPRLGSGTHWTRLTPAGTPPSGST